MAFIVRAFCAAAETPPLERIFAWTVLHGFTLTLDPGSSEAAPDSPGWVVAGVLYAAGRRPFLVDVKRDTGRFATLFAAELAGFIERIAALAPSAPRDRVLAQLAATRYVVSVEYLSDADDATLSAAGAFLDYFVAHHQAMVQADGEGFWADGALLLPLA